MANALLEVKDFGRRYRRRGPWAVRNATFSIAEGTITALVGPNGAGKSTVIRTCVGFEKPDEGRVVVAGADTIRDRTSAVNALGYVPQSATLYRNLTVGDHIAMGRAARTSFDSEYALRRVAEAGLSADRKVSELSGGEQAQVALALALGTRAPLLLLDEPLASLDPLARRDFLTALLDHVRERGATVVLSSHIVTDIEHACDWLLVLTRGRVVLHDAVESARRRFRIAESGEAAAVPTVGSFVSPDGRRLALVADQAVGRAATLEEVVLGHLAAGRAPALEEAA